MSVDSDETHCSNPKAVVNPRMIPANAMNGIMYEIPAIRCLIGPVPNFFLFLEPEVSPTFLKLAEDFDFLPDS